MYSLEQMLLVMYFAKIIFFVHSFPQIKNQDKSEMVNYLGNCSEYKYACYRMIMSFTQ